jgi:hypothetical protein
MLAVVATHGHCFDGLCSAVLFTQLLRHIRKDHVFSFRYHAMGYGPGQNGVDPKLLVGDENAILDYRFTKADNLSWYFDHHVSAFPTSVEREAFALGSARPEGQMFHDGTYGSCTKLIADIGRERFGFDTAPYKTLIEWADIIDRAAFPSAQMAVARTEPILQLMSVVEHAGDDAFLGRTVVRLMFESIEDVARAADTKAAFAPLQESRAAFVELVKTHAKLFGPVVHVDMSDVIVDVAGKFVTYAEYPESVYSVYLTRTKTKCKISVGYNPWCGVARTHNIAAICERYGGGGHPVVGAVSTTAEDVEKAKKIALEITEELAAPAAAA